MEFRVFKLIRTKNSLFNDGVPKRMRYSVEVEITDKNSIDYNPIYFRLFENRKQAEEFIQSIKDMGENGELYVKNNLSFIQCNAYR